MAKAFFHLGFLSILQNQSGDQADSLLSFYHLPLRLTSSSSIANLAGSESDSSETADRIVAPVARTIKSPPPDDITVHGKESRSLKPKSISADYIYDHMMHTYAHPSDHDRTPTDPCCGPCTSCRGLHPHTVPDRGSTLRM